MNRSSMPMAARCITSALALFAAPASAAVVSSSPGHFTLGYTSTVKATPDQAWATVINLPGWWSAAHSYSGKVANLSIDARAGGCWCERWTGAKGEANSIEHARIVMAMPGKVLRAVGGVARLFAGEEPAHLICAPPREVPSTVPPSRWMPSTLCGVSTTGLAFLS